MNRIASLIVIMLTFCSVAKPETSLDPLFQLEDMIRNKQYSQAIEQGKKLLQNSSSPQWFKLDVYASLSWAYLENGQIDASLDAFQNSVELGMNNYIVVHQLESFRKLFDHPRFKEIYGKMRISHADMLELNWIYREIMAIDHDANMMVIENMNRPDGDYTHVPQSKLPTRTPQSPTIILMREVVKAKQARQVAIVQQADMSRNTHNMRMNIIDSMGAPQDSYYKNQQKLRQIQQSRIQAQQRALQRQQAVQQRQFVLPSGTSTALEACPAFGKHPDISTKQ